MSINADLGKELEKIVHDLVGSGRFATEADVLRQGVRLVADRERKLAELDASIQEGLDDVEAGRLYDAEEVFASLKARYSEREEF